MIEKFNYHRNYHVNQSVWHDYDLILEGIIRFEYGKSILLEFGKDKESLISYQIQRIVADIKPSNFNEWQIRKSSLNSKLEINEIGRVAWRS